MAEEQQTPERISSSDYSTVRSVKVGGRREGAGRRKLYEGKRAERYFRVRIPRNLYDLWNKYKHASGCHTDGEFAQHLLELAGNEL